MSSNGPTVVLAHDHGGNKSTMLATAAVLHADYNLVLFDFRNHGQSGSAATTAGVYERGDLRAMLDWLEGTKHPVSIGVLGQGMGGAAAAAEAIGDIRVVAVVLDSTHATLANAIQARLDRDGFPLGLPGAWSVLMGGLIRTGQDMSAVDPLQSLARYGERPLLIVAAGQDDAVGANDAADLLAAAQDDGADAELQACAAAGHGQSVEVCAGEYATWVLGFLQRAMVPAS
jgi:pimeloyl-ACP methyl ester carboxylesterase